MKGLTEIAGNGKIRAIVLRCGLARPGTFFPTPPGFSLQLGLQIQPKGRVVIIKPGPYSGAGDKEFF